jgi:hypothetical protein
MRIREISEYGLERRDSKNSEKDKEKSEKSRKDNKRIIHKN